MFKRKRLLLPVILLIIFIILLSNDNNIKIKNVLLSAPFTAQAPFGEWSDPRQQDACEEASVLIAYKWYIKDNNLTKEEARRTILNMAAYEEKKYGNYVDTSAEDTALRLLEGYFGISDWELKTIDSTHDIVSEIINGNLLIIPMNGGLLNNPNFTPPPPERHMLVVIGYDADKKDIITHDPGTRQGKEYRYPLNTFFHAIRDYNTGYHVPFNGIFKRMIVVYSPDRM